LGKDNWCSYATVIRTSNTIEDTDDNKNNNYAFNERLNDTAGRICMCGIQDVITKGKIDERVCIFYGMIRTAGKEMAIKTTKFKDRSNRYDEQCKEKNTQVKTTLKVYKK